MAPLGLPDGGQALVAAAVGDPTWRGLAALDAATRTVGALVDARAVEAGPEAARLVETLTSQAGAAGEGEAALPLRFTTAAAAPPAADGTPQVPCAAGARGVGAGGWTAPSVPSCRWSARGRRGAARAARRDAAGVAAPGRLAALGRRAGLLLAARRCPGGDDLPRVVDVAAGHGAASWAAWPPAGHGSGAATAAAASSGVLTRWSPSRFWRWVARRVRARGAGRSSRSAMRRAFLRRSRARRPVLPEPDRVGHGGARALAHRLRARRVAS
jgi:hypothetical protein